MHARPLVGTQRAGKCAPGMMRNFAGQQWRRRNDNHEGKNRQGECADTQSIQSNNQLFAHGTEKRQSFTTDSACATFGWNKSSRGMLPWSDVQFCRTAIVWKG